MVPSFVPRPGPPRRGLCSWCSSAREDTDPGLTCRKDTAPRPGRQSRRVLPRAGASLGLMAPLYPESEPCHHNFLGLKPAVFLPHRPLPYSHVSH